MRKMRNLNFIVCLILAVLPAGIFMGCHSSDKGVPHVIIQTQAGDIEVEVYPGQDRKSVV